MCISGIYSLADEINNTESGISTSAVDIELNEYNQSNEPFSEDGKVVMPGEVISLIPRVHNLGIECYLRAKIEYSIEDTYLSEWDYIEGNYTSWQYDNGYYYYDSVFGIDESVDLFNQLTIPSMLHEQTNNQTVKVHIVVEAIQERNFDGNWDNVEIQESVDRSYDIHYNGESSIIYEDDTSNHVQVDDGFFDQLGNMLPGDSISENIEILNRSKNKNEYFLTIDYDDLTDEEIKLLQHIKLIVRNRNGETIVDSDLSDTDKHSLGIFDANEGDQFTIELTLPIDVDNEFSKLFTKVMWRFSYDVISYHEETNPNTGDLQFDLSITLFMLSALGLLVVLILAKGGNNEYIEKYYKGKGENL